MTKNIIFLALLAGSLLNKAQSYNSLWIPDTISGTNFNLTVKDTFAQIINGGNQTITGGINGKFWGPTLFFNKGDTVHLNVKNKMNDSLTLHWHGMHLPAVMDGGPHQVVPPAALWQPYWQVKNNAATYWYHPHMHQMTNAQMTSGIGGLIIVRDVTEAALAIPRSYGVDDFPLVITDRRFTTANQFVATNYTDSLMVNGVLRPQLNVPAQIIRFRILNTSSQHSYNLGFSDNRSFSIIASDGGLLDAPIALTRFILSPGERIEVLVDFTGQQTQTVNLMSYNSTLPSDVFGATHMGGGPTDAIFGSNFKVLHFNIVSALANAITSIPSTLVTNTLINQSTVNATRTFTFIDGFLNGFPNTSINSTQFNMSTINHTIPLNNTEIWQIVNKSSTAHTFHIHDVQFNVISRNGSTSSLQPYDMGWKDNVLVRAGETLKFIAKFEDYSDALHPFMYHCHLAIHEDEGMMGQFVVTDTPTGINSIEKNEIQFTLFPNPARDKIFIKLQDENQIAYYVTIFDAMGRTLLMLPKPDLQNGINISQFPKGIYTLQLTEEATKQITNKNFVIN